MLLTFWAMSSGPSAPVLGPLVDDYQEQEQLQAALLDYH
jgi:hypothetical protein